MIWKIDKSPATNSSTTVLLYACVEERGMTLDFFVFYQINGLSSMPLSLNLIVNSWEFYQTISKYACCVVALAMIIVKWVSFLRKIDNS